MIKPEQQNGNETMDQKSVIDTTSNSIDEKKEESLTNDQETEETQHDSSMNIQEDMQFDSFRQNQHHHHQQYHQHYHPMQYPYNLYLTPITEEIDHERTIVGLKEQNHKLTEQLRFLNRKLTEILSKQQKKTQNKSELEQKSKDISIVQKELENAYKKVEYLQKSNKFLQNKIEKQSPSMILALEQQVKEKDLIIQKQAEEIKAYEKIKRMLSKNNSTESKQMDSQTKIDEQEKQIINQNNELKKLKNLMDNSQKQTIKNQEHYVDMEQRFREVCEYLGISASSKSNLKEELQKIHVVKKSEQNQNADNDHNHILKEINENESPNKRIKPKNQENQIKELNSILKLKDKEIGLLKAQIQELKHLSKVTPDHSLIKNKRINHSGQSPQKYSGQQNIIREKNLNLIESILKESNKNGQKVIVKDYISRQKENEDPNIQSRKSSVHQKDQLQPLVQQQKLQPLKEEKERIKKEIIGKQHGCSRSLTDRIVLKEELHTKIVKVIVWTNKRTINGIQFFYSSMNEQTIEGQKIVVDKNNEYSQVVFDFNQQSNSGNNPLIQNNQNKNQNNNHHNQSVQISMDYLKSIECSLSNQGFIDKIKFTTAKGLSYEAGSTSNQGKVVQKLNLDECEYPVCAVGGLITFVSEKGQEVGSILTYLGFEIMIDQAFLKRVTQKYIPKGFSTFFFDKELVSQQNQMIKEIQADKFDSYNNSQ